MPSHYHPIKRGAIMVPLPDTQQKTDYSCGASAMMSVCRYFGLGPDYEEDFIDLLKAKGMDPRIGVHPYQLVAIADLFKLEREELGPKTAGRLKPHLRAGHPVLMMIQAWGEDKETGLPLERYAGVWKEGHWVVAIGYDEKGIFFEDPSLEAVRGYIRYRSLNERWHDHGPHGKHMDRYGLAVWKKGSPRGGAYARRARIID